MNKTATQVLQEAMFAAMCDAIDAMKKNAGGVANALARDLAAIHSNTSFDALPENVQRSLKDGVQDALQRLNKEGYTVSPKAGRPRS